jgi:hypothetical protein
VWSASGVAYSPRISVAALPGRTWIAAKTMSETRSRMTAIEASRVSA